MAAMTADNLEEFLGDLFYGDTQDAYGVICKSPGFAESWGFMDESMTDAWKRARELSDRHGVPFYAVTLRVSAKVIAR